MTRPIGKAGHLQNAWRRWQSSGGFFMGKPQLPEDYKEFLKLLNDNLVRYLVVGGFAVNYHGYSDGTAPLRIEVLTSISGVDFDSCFARRISCQWDGIPTQVLSLGDLKANKKAANRLKDLLDLEHLGGHEA